MKYCPSCGEKLDEKTEIKFCPSCGENLIAKKTTSPIMEEDIEKEVIKKPKQLSDKQLEAKSNAAGGLMFIGIIASMILSPLIPVMFIFTDISRNNNKRVQRPKGFRWWKRIFFYVLVSVVFYPLWYAVIQTEPFTYLAFNFFWVLAYIGYWITVKYKSDEELQEGEYAIGQPKYVERESI